MGAFNASGQSFSLTDGSNLAVAGVINASSVSLLAPHSTISLLNDSGFTGLTGSTTDPLQNQPFPAAGDPGLYVQAASITNANAGLTISGSAVPSITFALTGPGTVTLGNLQQPNAKLFLDLSNGNATGQINVAGFQVRYGPANSGGIALTGTVNGTGGTQAAGISFITPSPLSSYTLNLCAIGTNCATTIATSIPTVVPSCWPRVIPSERPLANNSRSGPNATRCPSSRKLREPSRRR